MRRAVVVAVLLLPVFFLLMAGGGLVAVQQAQASPGSCGPVDPGVTVDGLSADQTQNATAIIAKGKEMGVPPRGWVIAVATAYQESRLINVDHGDVAGPDSRGLFQQRDSWGPVEVRMDPSGAAGLFYARLLAVPGWETLPLAQAAQAVQRSAFPHLYQQWEGLAQEVVERLGAASGPSCANPVVDGWALPLPKNLISTPTSEHHDYPAVDLSAQTGTPVYSMTPGVVRLVEEPGGCGHGVEVTNGTDSWLYCHLSDTSVNPGQQVAPADQIGLSGYSGHVIPAGPAGAHLHVQLRRNGALACINAVVDELAAGRPAPAELRTTYPCLG